MSRSQPWYKPLEGSLARWQPAPAAVKAEAHADLPHPQELNWWQSYLKEKPEGATDASLSAYGPDVHLTINDHTFHVHSSVLQLNHLELGALEKSLSEVKAPVHAVETFFATLYGHRLTTHMDDATDLYAVAQLYAWLTVIVKRLGGGYDGLADLFESSLAELDETQLVNLFNFVWISCDRNRTLLNHIVVMMRRLKVNLYAHADKLDASVAAHLGDFIYFVQLVGNKAELDYPLITSETEFGEFNVELWQDWQGGKHDDLIPAELAEVDTFAADVNGPVDVVYVYIDGAADPFARGSLRSDTEDVAEDGEHADEEEAKEHEVSSADGHDEAPEEAPEQPEANGAIDKPASEAAPQEETPAMQGVEEDSTQAKEATNQQDAAAEHANGGEAAPAPTETTNISDVNHVDGEVPPATNGSSQPSSKTSSPTKAGSSAAMAVSTIHVEDLGELYHQMSTTMKDLSEKGLAKVNAGEAAIASAIWADEDADADWTDDECFYDVDEFYEPPVHPVFPVFAWLLYAKWPYFKKRLQENNEGATADRLVLPAHFPYDLLPLLLDYLHNSSVARLQRNVTLESALYALEHAREYCWCDEEENVTPGWENFIQAVRNVVFPATTVASCFEHLLIHHKIKSHANNPRFMADLEFAIANFLPAMVQHPGQFAELPADMAAHIAQQAAQRVHGMN